MRRLLQIVQAWLLLRRSRHIGKSNGELVSRHPMTWVSDRWLPAKQLGLWRSDDKLLL
ncbi:MAG: hypothetical protein KDB23_17680 [Planctomycetales bacterium]|nr:hypothetical protein [Planctomycetales bacterium]